MNRKNLLYTAIGVLALVVCLAGANWFGELRSFKQGQEPPAEQTPDTVEQEVGIIPGHQAPESQTPENQTPESQSPAPEGAAESTTGDTIEVALFFAAADGGSLEAELREIVKEEGVARATVRQLIAGPREEDLAATLPADTQLLDIDISNGLCTVDFSGALTTGLTEGDSQMLALYSIVNTLCQFDTVQRVQILVDGQQLGSVGGVDASQAMAARDF